MYKEILIFLYCVAVIDSLPFHRLHKIPADDDMLLFWKTDGKKACKPFVTSYVDCNRCICGADSVLYCTRIICMGNAIEYEYESDTEAYANIRKRLKKSFKRRKRRKHPKHDNYEIYEDNPVA